MTRIYFSLAIFSVLLLCANIVLGLGIGDYNGAFVEFRQRGEPLLERIAELRDQRPRPVEEIDRLYKQFDREQARLTPIEGRAVVHILFGVAAALVAVLVNSIGVTYFVGTSRWVREVVETYDFPRQWIAASDAIKRRTFPWAVLGMLTAVGIIALGAAAHPGTIRAGTAAWVTPHLIGAILGTALIAYAYYVQSDRIRANYELIERIVAEVRHVRREKGLDAKEETEKPAKPEYVGESAAME